MKQTEVLQTHYTNVLCNVINSKGGKASNAEDIFDNLSYLAKKQTKFGDEETAWLEINTKRMLAKIIDPECRIEFPVVKKEGNTLSVECHFYWSTSEKPVGVGFKKANIEQFISGSADAQKAEVEFEAIVRGAAETRALTNAGIGLDFYSDAFDALFSSYEEKEAEERAERKAEEANEEFEKNVPQIPSQKERKDAAIKRNAKAKKSTDPAPETENATAQTEAGNEADTGSQEETQPAEPVVEAKKAMTVDEAKMVLADMGNFKGQPLGLIFSAAPRQLVWLIKNDAACSEAARILVNTNEALARFIQ